jgi:hypothetical protein
MIKQSVHLTNGKTFQVPDNYNTEIIAYDIYNNIDDEIIKMRLLIITNEDTEESDEKIRMRYYLLSNVVSFGDDIEGCP